MERWMRHGAELVKKLALTEERDPRVIPYVPAKLTVSAPEDADLPRSAPEKHGVDSVRLSEMLHALEAEPRANVHSVMVLAGGEVISECSAPGYDVHVRHLAHSMSKTVTGMAIGLLYDAGTLDLSTPLVKIFPEYVTGDRRFSLITVKHLLTMQSGVQFAEAGSVTEDSWTSAFFASPLLFEPGTAFAYNSMNSYILGRIVERISGTDLVDLVASRIFAPLGIENYLWERGPEGTAKGGWGLYLSAESWAKLGQMMLDGGVFRGQRILSEEWVRDATTVHAHAPEGTGDFDYGYQLWVGREAKEFLFNGMLGQNVWVERDTRTVVVLTAGNNELFQESPSLNTVRTYLGTHPVAVRENTKGDRRELREAERRFFSERTWVHTCTPISGLRAFFGLREKRPFIAAWNEVLGTFRLRTNNVGMLPLFVRIMQNNFCGGLGEMELYREGRRLFLRFVEGEVTYRVEVGLYGAARTVLDFSGEPYLTYVTGEAIPTDNGSEFHILFTFPELPNDRMLTLSRGEDGGLSATFFEMPNQQIAEAYFDSLRATGVRAPFAALLDSKQMIDLAKRKIGETFCPTLVLVDANAPDAAARLATEEALRAERIHADRTLIALVDRVIVPFEERMQRPLEMVRGFFGGVFGRQKRTEEHENAADPVTEIIVEEAAALPIPTSKTDEI